MKRSIFYFLLPLSILLFAQCGQDLLVNEDLDKGLELSLNYHGQSQMVVESFTETAWNECTNEWVDLTGNFKTMVQINYDANGTPHISSKTGFSNVSGVGQTSGLKYRLVGTGAECPGPPCIGYRNVNLRCNPVLCPDGVVIFTGVVRQRLVSQSDAQDLVISAYFHITYVMGNIPILKQEIINLECS